MLVTAQKLLKYLVAVLVALYFVIALKTREVILIRKPQSVEGLTLREIESPENQSESQDAQVKETFKQRRNRLERQCEQYSDPYRIESQAINLTTTARIYQYNFFAYGGTNHMVCAVHKAGSNTITTFVTKILERGIKDSLSDNNLVRRSAEPDEAAPQFPVRADCWPLCASQAVKAVLVRHPLERLLSAYR